jgi:hypothetical protein
LKGRAWSIDEERLLRQLVEEGKGANIISEVMGKTRISVRAKMYSLGLSVKEATTEFCRPVVAAVAVASSPDPAPAPAVDPAPAVTSALVENVEAELKTKRPLPSIEDKLREIDDASKALHNKNLTSAEVRRIRMIIEAAKVYNPLFEKYVHYRDLENELVEVRRQLATERSKK